MLALSNEKNSSVFREKRCYITASTVDFERFIQGPYLFSETNFQDFSRTQTDFSRALKFTLTPSLPRSQC